MLSTFLIPNNSLSLELNNVLFVKSVRCSWDVRFKKPKTILLSAFRVQTQYKHTICTEILHIPRLH